MASTKIAITDGFMSIETAAQWCDVSPKTIERWLNRGLPSYQEGPKTKILIAPDDIRAFLTKRQAQQPDLDAMVEEVIRNLGI